MVLFQPHHIEHMPCETISCTVELIERDHTRTDGHGRRHRPLNTQRRSLASVTSISTLSPSPVQIGRTRIILLLMTFRNAADGASSAGLAGVPGQDRTGPNILVNNNYVHMLRVFTHVQARTSAGVHVLRHARLFARCGADRRRARFPLLCDDVRRVDGKQTTK